MRHSHSRTSEDVSSNEVPPELIDEVIEDMASALCATTGDGATTMDKARKTVLETRIVAVVVEARKRMHKRAQLT